MADCRQHGVKCITAKLRLTNIVPSLVAVDTPSFRCLVSIASPIITLKDAPSHLQDRGDSRTSADHAKLLDSPLDSPPGTTPILVVDERSQRSFELDRLANLQVVESGGHPSAFWPVLVGQVELDQHVDMALSILWRDWGIGSLD